MATKDWNGESIYWATILYARLWWNSDGPRLLSIREFGKMEPKMLRGIAMEYNVNRGIVGADKDKDRAAEGLCELLNDARETWPTGLVDRAEACREILDKAMKSDSYVHGYQISAITKFMWFLKPDGWTVFDSFAAQGAGVNRVSGSCKRMELFYQKLTDLGFERLSQEMQVMIDVDVFGELPATRILDMHLMILGKYGPDKLAIGSLENFLLVLPNQTSQELKALAEKLQSRFGNDVFASKNRLP